MPETNLAKLNWLELWAIGVVIISGGIGGCAAAFTNRSNEKSIITMMVLSGYIISGIFGALVMFAVMFTSAPLDTQSTILWSSLTGFSTAIALAGTNLGFKVVLKKLGIEIEVKVRKVKK